jgi:signal transduction histidine kinase
MWFPVCTETNTESRVLIFAPVGKDGALIEKILQQSGVACSVISEAAAVAEGIENGGGAAIITEEALSVEAIDLLSQSIASQAAWSDFPMLVLTGSGSSTPMTENAVRSRAPLGNITLLERPLRPATLISAVKTALRARKRQDEIRDHLRQRQQSEEALRRAHDELESLVEQRTAALRRLSSRLLRVQDEERRRIARELHDSLGQYLTATKINLDLLAQSDHLSERLKEAQDLLERAISDTRTLSHLLHPPLLDEAGLASAATWYIEGFGQRSGIKVSLEMSPDLQRLPVPVETALFRILQEALTNVHRHARSSAVDIRLVVEQASVHLTIRDYGKGIPKNVLERFQKSGTNVGVGLAGIRERIKELGGVLQIDSTDSGTVLNVSIPIADAEPATSDFPRAQAGFSASR